jgi:hypothetical protein
VQERLLRCSSARASSTRSAKHAQCLSAALCIHSAKHTPAHVAACSRQARTGALNAATASATQKTQIHIHTV